MTLGKNTTAFLADLVKQSSSMPPIETIPIDQLRADNHEAFRVFAGKLPMGVKDEDFKKFNINISSASARNRTKKDALESKISIISYTPKGYNSEQDPTLIFLYGSGFVIDIIKAHYPSIATVANLAKCKVLAIDYPLAPECNALKLPSLLYKTVCCLLTPSIAKKYEINLSNLFLMGYSSGGNLAAGVIYKSILESNLLPIKSLILLNPWLDLSFQVHKNNPYVIYQEKDTMLTTEVLEYLASLYLSNTGVSPKSPMVSPIFIKKEYLRRFPETHILSAQYDRLRGNASIFKNYLDSAGVEVSEKVFSGQIHNCFIARAVLNDGENPAKTVAAIVKGRG